MQCNPGAIGFGVALVIGWIIYAGVHHGVAAHRTGLMQAVSGAGAVLACLVAAGLVYGAMRIVERTPLPASREPAVITALALTPADAADMAADADALADGTLDVVVTAHRGLFELDERDGARP